MDKETRSITITGDALKFADRLRRLGFRWHEEIKGYVRHGNAPENQYAAINAVCEAAREAGCGVTVAK